MWARCPRTEVGMRWQERMWAPRRHDHPRLSRTVQRKPMTSTTRRRMRSSAVTLGVTAVMAAGLTGCSSSADYAAVCVNPDTEERVDDSQCDDDRDYDGVSSGFFW